MNLIGAILGTLAAYLTMSFLGLLSLVSPELSDKLLDKVQRWSNEDVR